MCFDSFFIGYRLPSIRRAIHRVPHYCDCVHSEIRRWTIRFGDPADWHSWSLSTIYNEPNVSLAGRFVLAVATTGYILSFDRLLCDKLQRCGVLEISANSVEHDNHSGGDGCEYSGFVNSTLLVSNPTFFIASFWRILRSH